MSHARGRILVRALVGIAALTGAAALVAAGREPAQDGAVKNESHVVLVTGANRGLGLEFAKEFCDDGWTVFATAREPDKAEELQRLGERVHVVQLDVTDAKSVEALAQALAKQPIDLLINNAGLGVAIDGGPKLADLKLAEFERVMQVNAFGPVRVTQALLPNLCAGTLKTIVGITSGLGLITANQQGAYYGYRESKAALDMFIRSIAAELRPQGFICIALMPGWVKTEMGGPNAPLTPEESVTAMRKVIGRLKPADNGKLWNYDGTSAPW